MRMKENKDENLFEADNNVTDEEAEKQYITETIIRKRKNKWLSRIMSIVFVIICAIIFGVVARVVFVLSADKVNMIFDVDNNNNRIEVEFRGKTNTSTPVPTPTPRIYPAITSTPTPTPTKRPLITFTPTPTKETNVTPTVPPTVAPTPTETPRVTPTNAPTEEPPLTPTGSVEDIVPTPTEVPEVTPGVTSEITPEPTPEVSPDVTPEITAEVTPEVTPEATPEPTQGPGNVITPTPYVEVKTTPEPTAEATPIVTQGPMSAVEWLEFLKEVMDTADEVVETIVDIETITYGTDWFSGEYEIVKNTTGLVIAQNNVDLLIITDYETVSVSGNVYVTFSNGEKVGARVFSFDKDYGIAVVSVDLNSISIELYNSLVFASLGEENEVSTGVPVVALGRPNGYENSIMMGMITSGGAAYKVRDGEVNYFTVDWQDYPKASAFVFTLDGNVCGMITHTYKNDPNDGITSCICLADIQALLNRLLNARKVCSFGIVGYDLPKLAAERAQTEKGIYVEQILAGSPAHLAGLINGDVITEINGEMVTGMESLMRYLFTVDPGTILQITYKRVTKQGMETVILTETISVTLNEK